MDSAHISAIVEGICKKYKINYESKNPNYTTFVEDAEKINKIYFQIKLIIEELIIIEEKYSIPKLGKIFDNDLIKLNKIDHHLLKMAKILRDQNV